MTATDISQDKSLRNTDGDANIRKSRAIYTSSLASRNFFSLLSKSSSESTFSLTLSSCSYLPDSALEIVAQRNPHLRKVDMSGCYDITDTGVLQLCKGCCNLQDLDLRKCEQISDISLSTFAQYSKLLISLNLSSCPNISSYGLIQLSRGCNELHTLGISNCIGISDSGLTALISRNTSLRSINLSKCHITSASLKCIGENCPQLTNLCIDCCDCQRVSECQLLELMSLL
mmetsp:Transcript_23987/g.35204  ORF Transcript_23987/g.35204 Transcript_23987/m.35204 type:complete len:230 (-) Transcript_23987:547-1236(-)